MIRPACRAAAATLSPSSMRPLVAAGGRRAANKQSLGQQRRNLFGLGAPPPARRPRTLRGTLARLGLAAGGVYWYATSDLDLFNPRANEHGHVGHAILDVAEDEIQLPTLESIAAARQERLAMAMAAPAVGDATESRPSANATMGEGASSSTPASPDALEEEAEAQGAFNEETGEINWDCPCLGGMAHGPCGEQFREAFSCFVYSKEEPKGVDCIDRFKNMQDCFRQHPDVYGAELTDDADEDEGAASGDEATPLDLPEAAPSPGPQTTTKPPAAEGKSKTVSSASSSPSTGSSVVQNPDGSTTTKAVTPRATASSSPSKAVAKAGNTTALSE